MLGVEWVNLWPCRTCGHVGCCDDSPLRHATKQFKSTNHPVIEGYDPPEGWGWCLVDKVMIGGLIAAASHQPALAQRYTGKLQESQSVQFPFRNWHSFWRSHIRPPSLGPVWA
jgi:hypothetical protein